MKEDVHYNNCNLNKSWTVMCQSWFNLGFSQAKNVNIVQMWIFTRGLPPAFVESLWVSLRQRFLLWNHFPALIRTHEPTDTFNIDSWLFWKLLQKSKTENDLLPVCSCGVLQHFYLNLLLKCWIRFQFRWLLSYHGTFWLRAVASLLSFPEISGNVLTSDFVSQTPFSFLKK